MKTIETGSTNLDVPNPSQEDGLQIASTEISVNPESRDPEWEAKMKAAFDARIKEMDEMFIDIAKKYKLDVSDKELMEAIRAQLFITDQPLYIRLVTGAANYPKIVIGIGKVLDYFENYVREEVVKITAKIGLDDETTEKIIQKIPLAIRVKVRNSSFSEEALNNLVNGILMEEA